MILLNAHRVKNPKYNLWLIHGYGESQACFGQVFEQPLAKEANIFYFDLPGFGQAPLITAGYETYLAELAQLIETENAGLPSVILGHSMGGILATLVAAQVKTRPLILFAIDSSLSSDQSPITNSDIGEIDPQVFKNNLLLKLKAQMRAEPDIKRMVCQVEVSDPDALVYWAKEGVRARESDRVLNLFADLACPKYYFIGERSFALPIRQRLIECLAPYLVWFPKAGHWIMVDTPHAFWQRVHELSLQEIMDKKR